MPSFENFDLESLVTPLNVNKFVELLQKSSYNEEESRFLIQGFTEGFGIGYQGPQERQSESDNITTHHWNSPGPLV